jgi:hypothetical protein
MKKFHKHDQHTLKIMIYAPLPSQNIYSVTVTEHHRPFRTVTDRNLLLQKLPAYFL